MNAGFKICDNKGFWITFENGWTVSVQFGRWNYCAGREKSYEEIKEDGAESPDCEIAAWDMNNEWYDFGDDKVKGHVTPKEVLAFLNEIAAR